MWINKILDFLFPEQCLGCKAKETYLCQECRKKLPFPPQTPGKILGATTYDSKLIKKCVHLLKYRGARKIAEPLSDLIAERVFKTNFEKNAIFIPIPLSKKRLRKRGFNQAELIAKFLSDKLSIGLAKNVLYKTRDTTSQVEIKNREKRLNNLKKAFAVKNRDVIKNKLVFLVDDISTTGATINEASKVLKQAGAKKIIGIVVAKG